jgi:hypothetical protein
MNPLEDYSGHCPWCDAPMTLTIDVSAGSQSYVEDCPICCAPILVRVELDRGGTLSVALAREGD